MVGHESLFRTAVTALGSAKAAFEALSFTSRAVIAAALYAIPGALAGYELAHHYPLFSDVLTQRVCQPYSPCRDAAAPGYVIGGIVVVGMVGVACVRVPGAAASRAVGLGSLLCGAALFVTLANLGARPGPAPPPLAPTVELSSIDVRGADVATVPRTDPLTAPSGPINVCEVERAFQENTVAALRSYPEGSRITLTIDVDHVREGESIADGPLGLVYAAGCERVALGFAPDAAATLRPNDQIAARCTFNFFIRGHTQWAHCTIGDTDPPEWFCACVDEHTSGPPSGSEEPSGESTIVVTTCRQGRDACDALASRARRGGEALVGLVAECASVEGTARPELGLLAGEALEPSRRAGGWQLRGRCALDGFDALAGMDE